MSTGKWLWMKEYDQVSSFNKFDLSIGDVWELFFDFSKRPKDVLNSSVCLNLNINNIERILSSYINFNDDKCVLAGSFFSKYQFNFFAKSLPLFCDYFVKNQDIDIILMDSNNHKYNYYISNFEYKIKI